MSIQSDSDLQEVTTLARLSHKHIVRYYTAWKEFETYNSAINSGENDEVLVSKTNTDSSSSTGTFQLINYKKKARSYEYNDNSDVEESENESGGGDDDDDDSENEEYDINKEKERDSLFERTEGSHFSNLFVANDNSTSDYYSTSEPAYEVLYI